MRNAEFWIERLGMEPHPEGGFYRETWRSEGSWPFDATSPFGSPRSHVTAIHYLLRTGERSRLHRIHSDELWFWHAGSPLQVELFPPSGGHGSFMLGADPDRGQVLQEGVPAESWFGAWISEPTSAGFALVSCVVAPGFDFRDFAFADRAAMLKAYPEQVELIERLT